MKSQFSAGGHRVERLLMINRVRFPTSSGYGPQNRVKHTKILASKSCQGPAGRKVEDSWTGFRPGSS